MSITREDILGSIKTKQQMDFWDYWTPEDQEVEDDHVYKTPTQMVKEYIKLSGQTPTQGLYAALVKEEFNEWNAERLQINSSPTAELKELTDLLYVIYGYAISKGWDIEGAFVRIHENNTGRMYQPDGTIKRNEMGKIVKNKDYPQVKLGDLI
jgi:hypothetical protein